jgi:hypothetical protein
MSFTYSDTGPVIEQRASCNGTEARLGAQKQNSIKGSLFGSRSVTVARCIAGL